MFCAIQTMSTDSGVRRHRRNNNNMTTSVAVERISELVDTLKAGARHAAPTPAPAPTPTPTPSPTPTPTPTPTSDGSADAAMAEAYASAADGQSRPQQPEYERVPNVESAHDDAQADTFESAPVSATPAAPAPATESSTNLQAGGKPSSSSSSKRKTRRRSSSSRSGSRSEKLRSRTETDGLVDVLLDNQMRIAQALALKIPAVVRCAQPLPNHRWPGGMHVNRPDARDTPDNAFTWYDGFNVFATESDATTKTFSDDKLRRTQVKNAKYPESGSSSSSSSSSSRSSRDDDGDGDDGGEGDTATFVHKRAWP
jgi:hypothetical protein